MSYTRLTLAQETDKPTDDRYLTPPWALRWMLRTSGWVPSGDIIWDPGAGGVRGWSLGAEVGKHHRLPYLLTDLAPASAEVKQGDFFRTSAPSKSCSHFANPPFDCLPEWLAKALSESVEVVLLVPVNWLFNSRDGWRIHHMTDLWVPSKRMAFGLDDNAIASRRAILQAGGTAVLKPNPTSITGWGFDPTGESHGWARWVPGYEGVAHLHRPSYPTHEDMIMPGGSQLGLFGDKK